MKLNEKNIWAYNLIFKRITNQKMWIFSAGYSIFVCICFLNFLFENLPTVVSCVKVIWFIHIDPYYLLLAVIKFFCIIDCWYNINLIPFSIPFSLSLAEIISIEYLGIGIISQYIEFQQITTTTTSTTKIASEKWKKRTKKCFM